MVGCRIFSVHAGAEKSRGFRAVRQAVDVVRVVVKWLLCLRRLCQSHDEELDEQLRPCQVSTAVTGLSATNYCPNHGWRREAVNALCRPSVDGLCRRGNAAVHGPERVAWAWRVELGSRGCLCGSLRLVVQTSLSHQTSRSIPLPLNFYSLYT